MHDTTHDCMQFGPTPLHTPPHAQVHLERAKARQQPGGLLDVSSMNLTIQEHEHSEFGQAPATSTLGLASRAVAHGRRLLSWLSKLGFKSGAEKAADKADIASLSSLVASSQNTEAKDKTRFFTGMTRSFQTVVAVSRKSRD